MRTWALLGLLTADWRWRDPNPDRSHVTALQHSLQTAARAERHDPDDDQMIVVALLHDGARTLSEARHGEVMAEILADRIHPEYGQVLRHHGCYQNALMHELDEIPCISIGQWDSEWGIVHGRENWHPYAVKLAAWDAASFDPTFVTPPLEHFLPRLQCVLGELS